MRGVAGVARLSELPVGQVAQEVMVSRRPRFVARICARIRIVAGWCGDFEEAYEVVERGYSMISIKYLTRLEWQDFSRGRQMWRAL